MEEKLKTRLHQLRDEFAQGQTQLKQLEAEASDLRQTLLRMSGAIQVLEEELGEDTGPDA